jgi:hypothetical protein
VPIVGAVLIDDHVMEFRDGLVTHETQYFADRFDPAPSRAHLVER